MPSRSTTSRLASVRMRRWPRYLGITVESLRMWVRKDDSQAAPGRRNAGGSEAEELARLRAENARLLKAEKEWQLERVQGCGPASAGRRPRAIP